jgi:hypothetical protein
VATDTSTTNNEPEDMGEFRKKFEKLQKDHKDLQASHKKLERSNMIHDAKLSHLNPRQTKALFNSFDEGEEITVDTLTAAADELGYKPPKQTKQQQTQQQPDTSTSPTDDDGDEEEVPDPNVDNSITGLTDMELAHVMAGRGSPGIGNLEEAMKGAKTQEELIGIIRSHGPKSGIVLDTDIE